MNSKKLRAGPENNGQVGRLHLGGGSRSWREDGGRSLPGLPLGWVLEWECKHTIAFKDS